MAKHTLRQVTQEDKQRVLEWRNHEDVRKVMFTRHKISDEEHHAWWNNTINADDRQILIFEIDDKPLGVVTIYKWDKVNASACWGFYLNNADLLQSEKNTAWIALEQTIIDYSESTLKLHKLYCETLLSNQLAWTLHKKLGFKQCPKPQGYANIEQEVVYMVYTHSHHQPDHRPSLFVLASHNTDFLSQSLIKLSQQYPQFPYKIGQIPFGQYPILLGAAQNTDNTNTTNALLHPDSCLLFVERIEDFFSDITTANTLAALEKVDDKVLQYLQLVVSVAKQNANVYLADFALQKPFAHSVEQRHSNSSINQYIQRWNQAIYKLNAQQNIHVLCYQHLISTIGSSFSDKYWYLARAPFTPKAVEDYSKMIIGTVLSACSRTARVLVLDLDNTLWHGVIGDDGIAGIALGGDYPGNIYQDLQSLFLALKQRGILLCISSKNTESIALNAIEQHPEMRLKKKDFVSWRINWQPKSVNIASLAQELNIGLESFCFIDDNPVERAEVKACHPQMFVPSLPKDASQWYQFICALPELYLQTVTESDKNRHALYQQRQALNLEQQQFSSRKSFLSSLNMSLLIEPLSSANHSRTLQLFTKTNQFNTTTQRYNSAQLNEFAARNDTMILHVKVKDKYREQFEGIAALVISQTLSSQWVIENFVMSCRVMGRDIEQVLIKELLLLAKQSKAASVLGRYIPSAKNNPVKNLYPDNGFSAFEGHWCYQLSTTKLERSNTNKHDAELPNIDIQWHNIKVGEQR